MAEPQQPIFPPQFELGPCVFILREAGEISCSSAPEELPLLDSERLANSCDLPVRCHLPPPAVEDNRPIILQRDLKG